MVLRAKGVALVTDSFFTLSLGLSLLKSGIGWAWNCGATVSECSSIAALLILAVASLNSLNSSCFFAYLCN